MDGVYLGLLLKLSEVFPREDLIPNRLSKRENIDIGGGRFLRDCCTARSVVGVATLSFVGFAPLEFYLVLRSR